MSWRGLRFRGQRVMFEAAVGAALGVIAAVFIIGITLTAWWRNLK